MSKQKHSLSLTQRLLNIKNEGGGHITFLFNDGTTQIQRINKEMFFDEKDKSLNLYTVIQKINDLCHDLKAVSYKVG